MSAIMDRAAALARDGRPEEGQRLVEQSADAGDGEALLAVANWRLLGMYGPRDLAAAHLCLDRAAAAGNLEAARTLANLIANGTGCVADFERARAVLDGIRAVDADAAAQLDLLDQVPGPDMALKLPASVLSSDPVIFTIAGLLTSRECEHLIAKAEPNLRPSFVINPDTGAPMPHPVRTSHGMSFGPPDEDLVVNNINRRLAAITRTQLGWGEPLHMLRYTPGQEFRPHIDALPNQTNQRQWTVLIYLNAGYQGGETVFPDRGVRYRGNPGDALVFRNVTLTGQPDPATRHAGLPVTSGTKWLATRWIRAADYNVWPD